MSYLSSRGKWRGGTLYLLGLFAVLRGYYFIGLLLQWFGTLNLFANFLPIIYSVFQGIPYLGTFLRHPIVEEYVGYRFCGLQRNNL